MSLRSRFRRLLGRDITGDAAGSDTPIEDPFDADFERQLELLGQLNRHTHGSLFSPARRDKRRGSGVEFADFRDYVPGDDFRFVDPHAAMRLNRLLLRQFEEETDPSLYLLVDTSSSMDQPRGRKLRLAKRLAAAIAYLGLNALNRVTVIGLGETANSSCPTTRSKGQQLTIQRFLRDLRPTGGTALDLALRRFASQDRRRGIAVLLSDLYDPKGFARGLDALRYERFEPRVLHIFDGSELELGSVGDLTLVDCETGVATDVTVTSALMSRLRQAHLALAERAEHHCRTLGLGYLRCDTELGFEQSLRRLLGQHNGSMA